jgi:hypothetical protein
MQPPIEIVSVRNINQNMENMMEVASKGRETPREREKLPAKYTAEI